MIKNMKVTRSTLPSAYICTNDPSLNYPNHGRKSVQHNKIYLKDGEEFEIELHNPMSENVLAVISLDGKPISSSGIVIRAGQRIYLDCFYDDKKKFVYRTYEVDNTSEAREATAKNGLFEVQFFKEKILKKYEADQIVHHHHHQHYNRYPYWNGWYNGFYYVNGIMSTGTLTTPLYYGTTTTNATGGTLTASSNNMTFTSGIAGSQNISSQVNTSNFSNNLTNTSTSYTANNLSDGNVQANYSSSIADYSANVNANETLNFSSLRSASLNNAKVETGQVDKGATSSQNFTTIDMDFEDSLLNKVSYQLLPESRKPLEFSTLTDSRKIKLTADDIEINGNVKINGQTVSGSKVQQLLELKEMLKENLITQSEFDILKKEII